jgi:antitoxin VapB
MWAAGLMLPGTMYIAFVFSPFGGYMSISTAFSINRTQAVCLPAEARFPELVKKVDVSVAGPERIIAPAESAWDSFFLGAMTVTDDFMEERISG